jgi:hypothetical protein
MRTLILKAVLTATLALQQLPSIAGEVLSAPTIITHRIDAEVMLADRSVIRISLNANFENTLPQYIEPRARNSVFSFLNNTTQQITLQRLKHDSQVMGDLLTHLTSNLGAKSVYPLGYTLLSPPNEEFELGTRTVSAILTSGEGVELIFATGWSSERPNRYLSGKVYELLSRQSLADLKYFQARLKTQCQEVNTGFDCPILAMKIVSRQ